MPSTLKGGKRQRTGRNTRRNPVVRGGDKWRAGTDTCVFKPVVKCQGALDPRYLVRGKYVSRVVKTAPGARSWDAEIENFIKSNYPNFYDEGIVSLYAHRCKPNFSAQDLTGQPVGTGVGCDSLDQSKRGPRNDYDNLITKTYEWGNYFEVVNGRFNNADAITLLRGALNAAVGLVPDDGPWIIHADCHLKNILIKNTDRRTLRSGLADWGRCIRIIDPNDPQSCLTGLEEYLVTMRQQSFEDFRNGLRYYFPQHPPEILTALGQYVTDLRVILSGNVPQAIRTKYGIGTARLSTKLPVLRAFTSYAILTCLKQDRMLPSSTDLRDLLQSTSQLDLQGRVNTSLNIRGFVDINAFPRQKPAAAPSAANLLGPMGAAVSGSPFVGNNPSGTAHLAVPMILASTILQPQPTGLALGAGAGFRGPAPGAGIRLLPPPGAIGGPAPGAGIRLLPPPGAIGAGTGFGGPAPGVGFRILPTGAVMTGRPPVAPRGGPAAAAPGRTGGIAMPLVVAAPAVPAVPAAPAAPVVPAVPAAPAAPAADPAAEAAARQLRAQAALAAAEADRMRQITKRLRMKKALEEEIDRLLGDPVIEDTTIPQTIRDEAIIEARRLLDSAKYIAGQHLHLRSNYYTQAKPQSIPPKLWERAKILKQQEIAAAAAEARRIAGPSKLQQFAARVKEQQSRPEAIAAAAAAAAGTGATGFVRQLPKATPTATTTTTTTTAAPAKGLRAKLGESRARRDARWAAAAEAMSGTGEQAGTITAISGMPTRQLPVATTTAPRKGALKTTTTTTTTTAAAATEEAVGPFFTAIYNNDAETLQEIIDGGFNVNMDYEIGEGTERIYPLEYAIKLNRPEMVFELLFNGANHCSLVFINSGGAGEYITIEDYVERLGDEYDDIKNMIRNKPRCTQPTSPQDQSGVYDASRQQYTSTMTATRLDVPSRENGTGTGTGTGAIGAGAGEATATATTTTTSSSSGQGLLNWILGYAHRGGRRTRKHTKKSKQSKRRSRR